MSKCKHATRLTIDGGGWFCPTCNRAITPCDECNGAGCEKCKQTGWLAIAKRSKMNNRRTWSPLARRWFDSEAEANRYTELHYLCEAGKIKFLQCQRMITLQAGFYSRAMQAQIAPIVYTPDFYYLDVERDVWVFEEVKGFKTKDYRIRRDWLLAKLETPEWQGYTFQELGIDGRKVKRRKYTRRAA